MKSFLTVAVFTVIVSASCFGQAGPNMDMSYLRTVIPPSPTAGALGKYGDWPVSLYTGVPEISIPLYEMQTKSITIPISLNYHASGIRVSEIASWTGLGWSLNAGGVIVRSVRGFPDEINAGYLEVREQYTDVTNLESGAFLPNGSEEVIDQDSLNILPVAQGSKETEPDQFSINALGTSYKLLYTSRRDSFVTQPYSRMKVIMHEGIGRIDGWTVTMEDGTRLIFGMQESYYEKMLSAYFGNLVGDIGNYITSWYLKEIKTPQNEVVTFKYSPDAIAQAGVYSKTEINKSVAVSSGGSAGGPTFTEPDVLSRRLKSIHSDNEIVEFDSIARWDLSGGRALKSLKVKSIWENAYKKQFDFRYEYSHAASGNNFGGDSTYTTRLKLLSVREVAGDSVGKVWDFEYNPGQLPHRSSYAQDHWGYFNGATSNQSLFPYSANFPPPEYKFGNRNPHATAILAEMLTKITYPTGGYSEFNFEANSIPTMVDVYADIPLTRTVVGSDTFHIHKPQIVTFTFSATFLQNDFGEQTNLANASLRSIQYGSVEDGFLGIKGSDLPEGPQGPLPPGWLFPAEASATITLPAGDYVLTVNENSGALHAMEARLSYNKFMGQEPGVKPIGGTRVKTIFNYDPNTDQTITRSFVYENPFIIDPVTDADYEADLPVRVYNCANGSTQYTWPARYTSLQYSRGDVQGGTVGYGKVTTLYGENGVGGKTVSYFTNYADFHVADSKVPPFVPIVSIPWRRGVLKREEQFDADDRLIRITRNSHDFIETSRITAFKASLRFMMFGDCQLFDNQNDIIVRTFYDLINEQVNLKSTEQVDFVYHESTIDSIKVRTEYFYDNPSNPQPTRIETLDSKNVVLKTINEGPLEKSIINLNNALTGDAKAALNDMVYRNMLNYPVRSIRYRGGVMIDSMVTNYKKWPANITAPQNIVVRNGTGPIETRVSFFGYDSHGNLRQQSKTNDVSTSYIYDYNFRYPIAQVVNSDTTSIAYTSFEANGRSWNVLGSNTADPSATTGSMVHILSDGNVQKTGLSASVKYVLSFWHNGTLPTITGGTPTVINTFTRADGWKYYEASLTNVASVTLSGSSSIDELRLYPSTAQMSTYTYDPIFGVTSATDVNSTTSYYVYDVFGRLKMNKDHNNNITKRYTYHYKIK